MAVCLFHLMFKGYNCGVKWWYNELVEYPFLDFFIFYKKARMCIILKKDENIEIYFLFYENGNEMRELLNHMLKY